MLDSSNIEQLTVDSDLGCFGVFQWRPRKLTRWVQQLWYFEGRTAFARERTFPDGTAQIIVQFGARYRDVHGDRLETCPASCLTGLQTGPLVIEAPDCWNAVLGIRLRPEGAFALFGPAMGETLGLTADLRDMAGAAADQLEEACERAASARGRLAAAASWVERRAAVGLRVEPPISWLAAAIEARKGAVSIGALRDRVGMSKTRLVSAFRAQIGLTPKHFARIHRFRHLLGMLDAPSASASLADLALEAGYYDQSHMNAEFRQIAGATPTSFLGSVRYPKSVSVAESAG